MSRALLTNPPGNYFCVPARFGYNASMSTNPFGKRSSAVNRSDCAIVGSTARRWNGWYRATPTRRWQILATSDDYAACLRELRAAAPNEGGMRELLVSPRHRNPNQPRFSH